MSHMFWGGAIILLSSSMAPLLLAFNIAARTGTWRWTSFFMHEKNKINFLKPLLCVVYMYPVAASPGFSCSASPNIARIRWTSTTPRISFSIRVTQIASATWSTWMGGMVRALAMESNEEPIWLDEGVAYTDPSDLRMLEGVGTPGGKFLWMAADKSKRAAAGVVRGR